MGYPKIHWFIIWFKYCPTKLAIFRGIQFFRQTHAIAKLHGIWMYMGYGYPTMIRMFSCASPLWSPSWLGCFLASSFDFQLYGRVWQWGAQNCCFNRGKVMKRQTHASNNYSDSCERLTMTSFPTIFIAWFTQWNPNGLVIKWHLLHLITLVVWWIYIYVCVCSAQIPFCPDEINICEYIRILELLVKSHCLPR